MIKGYKFNTELDAQTAMVQCANFYGLPVSDDYITIYFVDYNYSALDGFWYIIWVDGCTEVLGQPDDFPVTFPQM
jgi:hypothetical protein